MVAMAVLLDGSDRSLGATLTKGASNVKNFKDSACKDLATVNAGFQRTTNGQFRPAKEAPDFLRDMGAKLKGFKKERRTSGENAMATALGSPEGMVQVGMQSLGMGMQALAVEGIGRAFKGTTDLVQKLATGKEESGALMKEWAEGLPLLGGFVSGWEVIIGLIDGSVQASMDLGRHLETNKNIIKTTGTTRTFQRDTAELGMTEHQKKLAELHQKATEARSANAATAPQQKGLENLPWWKQAQHFLETKKNKQRLMSESTRLWNEEHGDKSTEGRSRKQAEAAITKNETAAVDLEKRENRRAVFTALRKTDDATKMDLLTARKNSALTGEDSLTAQHDTLTQQTKAKIADINNALAGEGVTGAQKATGKRQIAAIQVLEKSEHDKLDRDEGKRHKSSLLDIEQDIAKNRLTIQKAHAKDAEALWAVQAQSIQQQTDSQLVALDKKLEDTNLLEDERNKLIAERKGIIEAGAAENARAKDDFDKDLKRSRASTAGSLMGSESNLLGKFQSLAGGDSPEARKMQKKLGVMQDTLSMKQSLQGIIDDTSGKSSESAKNQAKALMGGVDSWAGLAGSDKMLSQMPYDPLRFSGGDETLGSRGGGRAAYAQEADKNAYDKANAASEARQQTNNFLAQIVVLLTAQGKSGDVANIWPNG